MFFWGLAYLEELEYDWHIHFSMKSMMPKLRQIARDFEGSAGRYYCKNNTGRFFRGEYLIDFDAMMYDFDEQLRPQARDLCILLLGDANYKCTSCPPIQKKFLEYARDSDSFTDLILHNLKALLDSDLIAPIMKQQIDLIQGELERYRTIVNPAEVKKLCEVISQTRTWLSRVSCLIYLYWSDGKVESMASTMGGMLSSLLQKTKPFSTSKVISSHFQPTMIPQLLTSYFDFLLEDLLIPMKDDIEILQEGLTFLLSFILDPPEHLGRTSQRVFAALNSFPSLKFSIRFGETDGAGLFKTNFSDFLLEIDTLKAEVRNLYVLAPYTSQTASLKTNVLGFFNSMMENLKNIIDGRVTLIPFVKNACEQLRNFFLFLQPFLKRIMELLQGNKHKEIQDLWRKIIEMVYNADYVIKLYHVRGYCAWYDILSFSYVIEHLRSIQIEINKLVEVDIIHFKKKLDFHGQANEIDALRSRGRTSEDERVCMGFIEDQRVIFNEITSRNKTSLTIISISGSGGQGKTTLAKRIYNDPNLQCYFHKFVWCYVSEKCPMKEVLVQAVCGDIRSEDAKKMDVHELSVHLWKSLREKRYLIVLDDIWDEDAWGKLEKLFPDDNYGSRILFTTRNHDLASKVKPNSISHPLPLFSDEECWKLMEKGVFGSGSCDEAFTGIGKRIASYCKGLPLAVALITAVLGSTEQNLVLWNIVADNLKMHLADKGCGKVIELSYNYLPDHLKLCFQYFGAFKRGTDVRAKELKLLWISEGFVIEDENLKSSEEDIASEYLNSLVSQSLVTVIERSCTGGIKTCNVHDLLYDMCLEKCKDDNFLNWVEENDVVVHDDSKFNHHRLWVGENDSFTKSSPIVTKRELPTSSTHSFMWDASVNHARRGYVPFLVNFKILTILKLRVRQDIHWSEFPEVILSCIFLRYLSYSIRAGSIKAIPPTIANLWKLRILIIINGFTNFTELPRSMWNMKSLRHVDIKEASLGLKDSDGKDDSNLFGEECSNIETLGSIRFDEDTIAEFLRKFPNLRNFSCVTSKPSNHLLKLLSMVGSLESLKVRHNWFVNPSTDTFSGFPKMENLNILVLLHTTIPWSVVSEIGKKLPNLSVLKLVFFSREGGSWKLGDGDFSKLIYLKLSCLSIEEIDVSRCDDPFPCLKHLVLENCAHLKQIPHEFGEITTLETIKVIKCSESVETSAMKILEVQREYGNDILQVTIGKRY